MRDEERITSHHFRIVGIKCFCAVKTHRSCCPGDLVWQSAHTQGLHLSIGAPVQNPTIEFLPCSSRATFKMTFQMWAGENRTTSAPTILYVVSACYLLALSPAHWWPGTNVCLPPGLLHPLFLRSSPILFCLCVSILKLLQSKWPQDFHFLKVGAPF